MVVHILKSDQHASSLNRMTAALGFTALGEKVREFTKSEFSNLELHTADIVVGGISITRRAFARLNISVPDLDPIPPELHSFAGRHRWSTTMQDLRQRVSKGESIFAKPNPDQPKLFTGTVMSSVRDLVETAHLDAELFVDCSEPVEFLSEYRTFVINQKILGLRHYFGDPLIFPDANIIRNAIKAFKSAPSSYTLDVGITSDARTLVVEINDAYACGAYGLPPIPYAKFIAARWDELRCNP